MPTLEPQATWDEFSRADRRRFDKEFKLIIQDQNLVAKLKNELNAQNTNRQQDKWTDRNVLDALSRVIDTPSIDSLLKKAQESIQLANSPRARPASEKAEELREANAAGRSYKSASWTKDFDPATSPIGQNIRQIRDALNTDPNAPLTNQYKNALKNALRMKFGMPAPKPKAEPEYKPSVRLTRT